MGQKQRKWVEISGLKFCKGGRYIGSEETDVLNSI